MSRAKVRIVLGLALAAALSLIPFAALAHESVDSGNYHFEIGWVNEPVLVGDRNGLDLFVAPVDSPEEGISGITTLVFTVEYGGLSHEYEIEPVEDLPGHYTASFVPTREGQYTFHLGGTIEGETIDVEVEAEEVVAASSLAFPEAVDLGAEVAQAQAQASTAQTVAIVGAVLGLAGIAAGGYGLARKK